MITFRYKSTPPIMIKFQCNKCGKTKDLMKATLKEIDGKIRTVEALCECGEYMQEVSKDFNGFPSLIRTEPTLKKKRSMIIDEAKEKICGTHVIEKPK